MAGTFVLFSTAQTTAPLQPYEEESPDRRGSEGSGLGDEAHFETVNRREIDPAAAGGTVRGGGVVGGIRPIEELRGIGRGDIGGGKRVAVDGGAVGDPEVSSGDEDSANSLAVTFGICRSSGEIIAVAIAKKAIILVPPQRWDFPKCWGQRSADCQNRWGCHWNQWR